MKILVPIKRVIDFNVRVRVKPDGSGVDTENVKMAINPFDEISVEAAVRLREAGTAAEVIAVSVGTAKSEDVLRAAMAMGVDRAILVEAETGVEPLAVAKILKAVADTEKPGLVIAGKQAIDDDCNQTGQMLSALMGCALATYASGIEVKGETASVVREIDGGLQTVEVTLPAVITTDLRLNEPRYASLPNIMKARQKPLERLTPSELGVDVTPRLKVLETRAPQSARNARIVHSVAELVDRLKSEAGVI